MWDLIIGMTLLVKKDYIEKLWLNIYIYIYIYIYICVCVCVKILIIDY